MQADIGRKGNVLVSLDYNEQKVTQGKAEKIHAGNFLKSHDRLTKADIIERFRLRSSLNERLGDQGIHFSVNFGTQEKISNEKMAELTDRYMAAMGFEDHPYIVYRHHDAGHTHMHIVATAVRANGTLVSLHPGNYHDSHTICRTLEKEYSLEKTDPLKLQQKEDFAVDHAQRVVYGERGLTRAVSDVLNTVVEHYNYTSLDELNAVLSQYNVVANPGKEGSRLRETGGLLYHALDGDGHRIGMPLKASLFLLKPTMKNLEEKFVQNQSQREAPQERLSTAIEWALAGRTPDWAGFKESLEKEGITMVVDRNKAGNDRVFFVDHTGRASFEGKNLGDGYRLEMLRSRCAPGEEVAEEQTQKQQLHLRL